MWECGNELGPEVRVACDLWQRSTSNPTTVKKAIHPVGAAKPIAPYSPAIEAGGFVFLSGQIALDPATGELDRKNITAETHRVMRNIGLLLEAAGLGYEHLVKCTIFLSSMDHYAAVNEVYATYFPGDPPAREAVAVRTLPRNVDVEISAIAHRG